jgi:glycyl-tRNA synthetase
MRDYGPYGSLLRKNIYDLRRKHFVQERDDIVGLDTTILAHPATWVASGHVGGFADALIDDKKTGQRFRADKIIETYIEEKKDAIPAPIIIVDAAKCVINANENYDIESYSLNKELADYLSTL